MVHYHSLVLDVSGVKWQRCISSRQINKLWVFETKVKRKKATRANPESSHGDSHKYAILYSAFWTNALVFGGISHWKIGNTWWCVGARYNGQQRTSWENSSTYSNPPADRNKQLLKQVFINILMTVCPNYRPLPVLNIIAHPKEHNPDQQMSWQNIKISTEILLDCGFVSSSASVFASCKDLPCVLAVQFVLIEGYSGTLSTTKVKTQRNKPKEHRWPGYVWL